MSWHNIAIIGSRQYQCGHCGYNVANDKGYRPSIGGDRSRIYICPNCTKPTYFDGSGFQVPGIAPGADVKDLPELLSRLYREARNCCSVSAYTAAVLACRKLLMNIAVEKGAAEGLKFIEYVEYLAANGYVPPNGKQWVDHIRKKGNEATHEIALMQRPDAEDLLVFIEMLLKFIYEFPSRVPS